RADDRAVTALGAVVRLHTPDGGDDETVDAIGALRRLERVAVLIEQLAAALDAHVAYQVVEVFPERLGEFRLRVHQVHEAQIRREASRVGRVGLRRYALARGFRRKAREAIGEIGGRGADRVGGHERMARRPRLPAPLRRAGRVYRRGGGELHAGVGRRVGAG